MENEEQELLNNCITPEHTAFNNRSLQDAHPVTFEPLVRRQNSFVIDKTEFRNAIEKFVNANRKINWEAEFERGQFCIGEDKLYEFVERILSA